MRIALGTLLAALVLAGCGSGDGGGSSGSTAVLAPPVGTGADRAWVLRPDGTPKSVVVFVHGLGGPGEIPPTNHLPWLRHLVAQGNAVIYPAYEVQPGGTKAVAHILAGVRNGMRELGDPKLPVAGIGYSRGGRLVVEWAALQRPAPKALLSVFPSQINPLMEPPINLRKLDHHTQLELLVGDRDQAVGNGGAAEMLDRLLNFGFPQQNIHGAVVHSTPDLVADHFAPLQTNADARRLFWVPGDHIVDLARGG